MKALRSLLSLLIFQSATFLSLSAQLEDIRGIYTFSIEGIRRIDSGTLTIAGERGDYYGLLEMSGSRTRQFAVGFVEEQKDTLRFRLSDGGFLNIYPNAKGWAGQFRYFRLNARLDGSKSGPPSEDLDRLAQLKPLAWGEISSPARETFPTLSKNGKLLYFTRDNTIFYCKKKGKAWSSPKKASFSGQYDDSAPYFSPDDKTLLFTSNRPNPNYSEAFQQGSKKDLWIVKRQGKTWSTPKALPTPVNVDSLGEYHSALAKNGIVYFVSYARPGGYGRSDLYRAALKNGEYEVSNLGSTINTTASEADVYVDPDERFILFVATDLPDSYGADDIYISLKTNEGWSKPKNLGPAVNSFAYEYGPWVDRKGVYLYFNSIRRGTSDIYRVSLKDLDIPE